MLVQGSPHPAQEVRFTYSEAMLAETRYSIPESRSLPKNEALPEKAKPAETFRTKSRWSSTNLLNGACPEFIESFAQ